MKIFKRISVSAVLLIVLGIFSCQNPTTPTAEFTVTVNGSVANVNHAAQDSVVITLDNPFRRDTTKTDGSFSYSFTSTEKNEITATFRFTHINHMYFDTVLTRTYSSTKKSIGFGEVIMKGVTASQDSTPPSKASARAGIVAFVSSSFQTISIHGAGGNEATNLTFEVRDSLGNPVDDKNKSIVSFKLVTAPDAQVQLNHTSASTSSNGQVVVQLLSGDKAGIAQVLALTTVKNLVDTTKLDTIKSQIVSVTIAGGLPVPSRFTIGANKYNVPGLVKFNLRNMITAVVGDTFGNPVQQGTLVYFSTTGGIIQPYSKTTADGTVSVDLITGNPIPANGLAVITAQVGTSGLASTGAITNAVVDENIIIKGLRGKEKTASKASVRQPRFAKTSSTTTFSKTINVLFTGAPRVSTADTSFVVPPLGTKQIQFTVDDINGNPMSQGTTIKVSGVGLDTTGATLTGNLDNLLPDTYDKSYTIFNLSIADKRTKNFNANIPITISIEVSGDNGNIKKTITGTMASIVSGDSGKIGSVRLVNNAVDSLVAAGAGLPNSVVIQAKVLTVNGQPSPNVPVNFSIVKSVNGGEYLTPPISYTNSSGIASATLYSGIRSGLVQVLASVKKDSLSVPAELKNVYIKTGKVSSLNLVSISSNSLSVKGGGGNESAILIFEAKDSLGNTIDGSNQANITMTFQGDTAGASINPSTVKTDPNTGRVTTNITSGSRSGIILVTAQSGTVKSTPVQLSVSGGQPVAGRFTLSTQKVNLPAGVQLNLSNTITAVLGDTFGNPVQVGTVVYFNTNGGIIQPAATTSNTGLVSVGLVTGNPFPPAGIATVTAQVGTSGLAATGVQKNMDEASMVQSGRSKPSASAVKTVDESVIIKQLRSKLSSSLTGGPTSVISKSVNIVFSGAPRVTSNDSVFVVPGLGTKQIQFTVDDVNGNPMSQGTSVKVSGVGLDTTGATVTGNIDNTIPDTDDKSWTKFNISIADKRTKNLEKTIDILLNVEVSGPNGNIKKTFNGKLASAASDSGKVGYINMVSTAVDTVVVNGAGSPSSSTIQAKVLDVSNNPSANIPVSFDFVKTVGGGEYLSSYTATTNASGIATVTFNSGIRSGLVQVQASVRKNTVSINSDIKSIYVKTGALTTLNLVSVSSNSLSVKGGGGSENAVLVFEAKDSLGNTIDGSNQANISMILQGDTAGARINPATLKTDPNTGRITSFLTAGSQSGIIQVIAKSGSVSSSAIQFAISGGLPAQSQFSVSLPKKNFSILTDKITSVSVTAGDAFGNPAKPGTLINFKTNGGLIDASALTSSSGSASTSLQIVNPQPASGIVTVEARTFGVGGVVVRDTQTVVFSRDAIISEIGGPYANFTIEDGLSKTFQFSVADINGNPLAQGNTISVQASGTGSANIVLTGDVNVSTTDTKIQGVGTTQFTFTARDSVKGEGQGPKPLSFKISVSGPNTSGTVTHNMDGTLNGGAGVGNEGSVASVSYFKSSNDTIFVANAGTPTTDTITFRVKNLNQLPVKGAAVQFSFTLSPNASEFLSPSYAVSNDSGEAKVVVHSGIKAGVMKVVATVTAGASSTSSTPVQVYVKTGPLSTIEFGGVTLNEISVRGVGGIENTNVTFVAKDILGNSLDFANQTMLYFNVIGLKNNYSSVRPDSALTDPFLGTVKVNVTGDTVATVLQVIAKNKNNTIKSSPVPIVVHGGFAVDSLFIFKNISQNFSIYGSPQTIVMQLGDQYGNPVKPGTAVYFGTTAGIVTAASFTDASGFVSTTFSPVANAIYQGNRTIKASTVGNARDSLITKTFNVLLSGAPIINVTNLVDTLTLFDGASADINFEIKDNLGNPISSGHQYSVSIESSIASQLALGGNIAATLPDTQDKINGTKFTFSVGDALPNSGTSGTFKIKITVLGVTGTTIKTIYGKLLAPANIIVPPTARAAASIALISSSTTDLSISGVGGTENATLTYEVRDSVGAPITLDNRATVNFSSNFIPNTYTGGGTIPTILPSVDSTDANGRVRVSILSGTQAGAIQLQAIINLTNPVRTIKSQPVKISVNSGFADQKHFTIAPAAYNFGGLQKAFFSEVITVQVGDKYSNPVKEGTIVYFNSANGIIQTQQGLTDKNGFVSMTLFSGNPYPLTPNLASGLTNGFSRVYARTIGRDSTFISDSLVLLWTGTPIITKTDAIVTFNNANGGSTGPFTFTAQDYLGHPLAAGTTISVDAPGLTVSGDANVTMPDTKSSGAGITSFTFNITDADATTNKPVATLITITVNHPVYGIFKKVIASGIVN